MPANVAACDAVGRRHTSRQQPARIDAIGRDADAQLANRGQYLGLDTARNQRVLDLQRRNRMHGVCSSNRSGRRLRHADVAHVTRLHHLCDSANGILDRHRRIDARRLVQIHVVRTESLQRVCQKIFHRGRARVDADERAARRAHPAEFHADEIAVAWHPGQCFMEQQLVVPHAVKIPGVEQIDSRVQRRMDGGDGLLFVRRAVHPGHAHTAQPERRDLRPVFPEPRFAHGDVQVHFVPPAAGP